MYIVYVVVGGSTVDHLLRNLTVALFFLTHAIYHSALSYDSPEISRYFELNSVHLYQSIRAIGSRMKLDLEISA